MSSLPPAPPHDAAPARGGVTVADGVALATGVALVISAWVAPPALTTAFAIVGTLAAVWWRRRASPPPPAEAAAHSAPNEAIDEAPAPPVDELRPRLLTLRDSDVYTLSSERARRRQPLAAAPVAAGQAPAPRHAALAPLPVGRGATGSSQDVIPAPAPGVVQMPVLPSRPGGLSAMLKAPALTMSALPPRAEPKRPAAAAASSVLVETNRTSANALLLMVNDILDFAKADADKIVIDTVDFDANALAGDVVRLIAPLAKERGLDLLLLRDATLPDRLVGDPGRLRQVLLNLVGNAIKFTESGRVEVELHMVAGSAMPGSVAEVQFTIRDTGIGIAAEVLDTIFLPFAQADISTTRRFGGTGLGLSISQQIVRKMGGEITVDSAVGRGSTFRFCVSLPVAQPAPAWLAPEDAVAPAAPRVAAPPTTLTPQLTSAKGTVVTPFPDALREALDPATVPSVDPAATDSVPWRDVRPASGLWQAATGDLSARAPTFFGPEQGVRHQSSLRPVPLTATSRPDTPLRIPSPSAEAVALPVADDAVGAQGRASQRPTLRFATADPPLPIDTVALGQLRQAGGQEVVRVAIDMFLETSDEGLAEIRSAHVARDAALLAAIAHRLRGAAASVGARRFTAALTALEDDAWAALASPSALLTLERELNAARTALTAYRRMDSGLSSPLPVESASKRAGFGAEPPVPGPADEPW